jgi:hypothetical protein
MTQSFLRAFSEGESSPFGPGHRIQQTDPPVPFAGAGVPATIGINLRKVIHDATNAQNSR